MRNYNIIIKRIHRSWLVERERTLLTGIAQCLPAFVTSDHLTMLGVFGAILCGASYALVHFHTDFLWLVCVGLVLNWFGDSLDGTVARLRNEERPQYGFFVDHSSDVISQAFIFFGLGISPLMRFDVACLALISYWILALYTFIRAIATGMFQISYLGVGPTEVRIGLLIYTLSVLAVGPVSFSTRFGTFAPIEFIIGIIFIATVVTFLIMAWREGRRLAIIDVPVKERRSVPIFKWQALDVAKGGAAD